MTPSTVLTQQAPAPFTVTGIATFGTADSAAGATSVLFTDAAAQQYLSSPGQIDGVAVQAVDGVDADVLLDSLAGVVPGLEVVSGATLIAEDQASFSASFAPFKIFLLVFAFVAVFVGAFMINNTFSITVAQRTKQLAMLRALGASRRQVLRSVMTEAIVIGVIGSAAGLAFGVVVACGAPGDVRRDRCRTPRRPDGHLSDVDARCSDGRNLGDGRLGLVAARAGPARSLRSQHSANPRSTAPVRRGAARSSVPPSLLSVSQPSGWTRQVPGSSSWAWERW